MKRLKKISFSEIKNEGHALRLETMSRILGGIGERTNKCVFEAMAYASDKLGCDNDSVYYQDQYRYSDIYKDAPGNSGQSDVDKGFGDRDRMVDYISSQFDFDSTSRDMAGILDIVQGNSSLAFATLPQAGDNGHCVILTGFSGSTQETLNVEYYDPTTGTIGSLNFSQMQKIDYLGAAAACK